MVTITNIATILLTQNNWTTPAAATYEYLIDDAIDYVNAECGKSIADLSGAGGSKSLVTSTDAEALAVKTVATLLGKAYNNQGPNANIFSISVTQILTDPHYSIYKELLTPILSRVRGRTILRT